MQNDFKKFRGRTFAFLATMLALVLVLPWTQADSETAQTITTQVASRALSSDLSEPLKGLNNNDKSPIRVSYSGPEYLQSAVLDELGRGEVKLVAGEPSQVTVKVQVEDGFSRVEAQVEGAEAKSQSKRVGEWWAIIPPLLAVLIALFFRLLIPALLSAVWVGGAIGASTPVEGLWRGGTFIWSAVTDTFSLYIIAFTIALVGMVHVMTRGGGVKGIVNKVGALAKTARSTRVSAVLLGFAIFFDDYANTFVVGTTMRPLTDAKRISREKLAYIVDSTSAPIAGLAVISTWIGYEVGLFEDLSRQLSLGLSGYEIFFAIMPLRFYCLGALFLVMANAWTGRDFGPMHAAEERALGGQLFREGSAPLAHEDHVVLSPDPDKAHRWQNAAFPILLVIFSVFVGMFWSGWKGPDDLSIPSLWSGDLGALTGAWKAAAADLLVMSAWRDAFSNADNAYVLFLSATLGSVVAIGMTVSQKILTVRQALRAWIQAAPTMGTAIMILVLAWSIRGVCDDLGTSVYLVGLVQNLISPLVLPLITFLLAAIVGFSTGTSWGAMGILLPAMIPLAVFVTHGMPGSELIVFLCFGAVMDGAIFGDHCSPISDTTVMSSIASGSDLMDHVRTQAPYAVLTMILAAVMGYVGVALGLPVWLAYVGIAAGSIASLFLVGRVPVSSGLEQEG